MVIMKAIFNVLKFSLKGFYKLDVLNQYFNESAFATIPWISVYCPIFGAA